FVRSDHLVRLLASRPGEGLGARMEADPDHVNLTVSRFREWWGDQGDAGSDRFEVNGENILNPANTPRTKRPIGMFVFDAGVDQVTDLAAPVESFFSVVFMTGMDVFVPAGDEPVSLVATQRGTGGHTDTVNVPAWPSDEHRISVLFNDYS
nr:alpha/beta hydrolase [Micromonospora sp. DSM 115978]